ncbi:hypothetical protein RI367_006605 [Sorochytrium milnesiophthora]
MAPIEGAQGGKTQQAPASSALLLMEVMLYVFAWLDARSLSNASRTCSRWRAIVGARPELWRMCFLRQYGRPKLPAHLYSPLDYKDILLYKLYRERHAWHGVAENAPRKLVDLPAGFGMSGKSESHFSSAIEIGESALAYFRSGRDAVEPNSSRPKYNYVAIQSIESSDYAEFTLPLRRTLQPTQGGDGETQGRGRLISAPAHDLCVGNNFVALETPDVIRVYPTTPHARPFRIDIQHEPPFNNCSQLTFENDILVITWYIDQVWQQEHEDQLHPSLADEGEAGVLRIYDFSHFQPSGDLDRFTVYTQSHVVWREFATPFITFLHATADFTQHLTGALDAQHRHHTQKHPARTPYLKVAITKDDEYHLNHGQSTQRMVVLAFDHQLQLIGVRKYEYQPPEQQDVVPYSLSLVCIHGHYLLDWFAVHAPDLAANPLQLRLYLDDSHSAPLPSADALDAIVRPSVADWDRAMAAFDDIPFVAPQTILHLPDHMLAGPLLQAQLQGHYIIVKRGYSSHPFIDVMDVHTGNVVASRAITVDGWQWGQSGDQLERYGSAGPDAVVRMRLRHNDAAIIRAVGDGAFQLEHLPYRLLTLSGQAEAQVDKK